MSGFASGPWVSRHFDDGQDIVKQYLDKHGRGALICVCTGDSRKAHARAIAALPNLLDALENMLGAFDTPVARMRLRGEFEDEARASARAALIKAGRLT